MRNKKGEKLQSWYLMDNRILWYYFFKIFINNKFDSFKWNGEIIIIRQFIRPDTEKNENNHWMYEHLFCSCEHFLEFWPSAHWLKHDGFYTWISPSVVLHVSGKDLSNMQAFPVIVVDRLASRWGPGPSPLHWAVWEPYSSFCIVHRCVIR